MKDILNNPDKSWNWDGISQNKNITMKNILNNPDKNWDWDCISLNPNITIKNILDNPDKYWNYNLISSKTFKNDKNNYIKSNTKKILLTRFVTN